MSNTTVFQRELQTLKSRIIEKPYLQTQYLDLVPVNSEAKLWSDTYVWRELDGTVQYNLALNGSTDSYEDVSAYATEQTVRIFKWGATASVTPEQRQAINDGALSINIMEYDLRTLRSNGERYLDKVVLEGNPTTGTTGLFNNPNVPIYNVPNGAGGTPEFTTKTIDEIITDHTTALTTMEANNDGTAMADTIVYPRAIYNYLVGTRIPDNSMTLMEYLEMNVFGKWNINNVIKSPRLKEKGVGGVERIVIYWNNSEALEQITNLYTQQQDLEKSPTGRITKGEIRTAGVLFYDPLSAIYVDGV